VFVLWDERAGTAPAFWDGTSLGREIVAALDGDTLDRLHTRFTARPLILIDDLEKLAHPAAQQALAHLLDAAAAAGRCVVVTMRVPPHACTALERTLATRLCGGLVITLPGPPLPGPGDAAAATTASSHAGTTLRRVIAATARHYGLEPADLTGPSRRRAIAHARSLAMYLSRKLTSESLLRIGAAFGDRDHTTVMHSLRVTEERIRKNAALGSDAERLLERLLDRRRQKGLMTASDS
jgi:chromosomal replication initiation ATPase DnaA